MLPTDVAPIVRVIANRDNRSLFSRYIEPRARTPTALVDMEATAFAMLKRVT